jgi:hypothetical protein
MQSKFLTKQGTYRPRFVWRLIIALILAISLWLISPLPTAAQSVSEYFQIDYDPVSFSQNEIHGSEVFYATIHGSVTCTKDLPASVSEASITSRVVAEDTKNGTVVILNSSYTVTIKPFPSKEGDTTEINQVVPLQFPARAESGDYNVIGELVEAKVKVAFVWGEVTEYLPHSQLMGSLEYISPGLAPGPLPTPTPTPTPTPPGCNIAWWVWLIVAVAVATTMANIICLLRYRTVKHASKQREDIL